MFILKANLNGPNGHNGQPARTIVNSIEKDTAKTIQINQYQAVLEIE